MRGEAVGGGIERRGEQVGAPDQGVEVHPHVGGAAEPRRAGVGRFGAGRGRTADAGGLDLGIDGLEVGQHADARVAAGDLRDGIREVLQPAAQVSDLTGQPLVLRFERGGAREIQPAGYRGVADEQGAHEEHHAHGAGEPQQAPRHLEHLRGRGAVRYEQYGPPALSHCESA